MHIAICVRLTVTSFPPPEPGAKIVPGVQQAHHAPLPDLFQVLYEPVAVLFELSGFGGRPGCRDRIGRKRSALEERGDGLDDGFPR